MLAKHDPRAPGRVTCSLQTQGKKTLGGTGRRLPGTWLPRLFVPTRRVTLTARRARAQAAGCGGRRRGWGEAAPLGQGRARAAPLAAPRPRTRLRLLFFRPLKGAITSQTRVWSFLKIKLPGVPGEPEAPAGPGVGEGGARGPRPPPLQPPESRVGTQGAVGWWPREDKGMRSPEERPEGTTNEGRK